MTAPEPADGREPRFAGSIPSGSRTPPSPPAWSRVASPMPPAPLPAEPLVSYGPGFQPPEPEASVPLRRWAPVALAGGGGVLAAIACFFNWASLRLVSSGSGSQAVADNGPNLKYNGFSLLEGRVLLVLGAGSVAVSGIVFLRRALAGVLVAAGAVGLVTVAFAAIGHPVELATLFRSYQQIDGVTVSLPDGVGIWLAMGGAVLILVGGLLTQMWREPDGNRMLRPDRSES